MRFYRFGLLLTLVLVGCNQSKKYHLKRSQQKTQNHEHKPVVKVVTENLKHKDRNFKASYKQQRKIQESQRETEKRKKSRGADFNFY